MRRRPPRRSPSPASAAPPPQRPGTLEGSVRIIGGDWRGSRLSFPDLPGLRPTPDRVRETLFNWLAPILPGSRCLDLCAGAGALGLEALSRGAADVTFVDEAPASIRAIEETIARLPVLGTAVCVQHEALAFLARGPVTSTVPDIIFVDPPYAAGLTLPLLEVMDASGWLAAGQRVYLENDAPWSETPLHLNRATLTALRTARAGRVYFGLWRVGFTPEGDAS